MNNERSKAEADLRVIRSLMERATVYRAISAPASLVAGLLSIFAAAGIYLNNQAIPVHGRVFAAVWLIVLILAVATNAFFIWREAKKDGRPFISSNEIVVTRYRAESPYSSSSDTVVPGRWLQRRRRAGASRSLDRFLRAGTAFYRPFCTALSRLPWVGILANRSAYLR